MKKNIVVFIILVILAFSFNISFGDDLEENFEENFEDDIPLMDFEKGKVLTAVDKVFDGDFPYEYQEVEVLIETGEYKGEIVTIENAFSGNEVYDIRVKSNQNVILAIENYDGKREVYINDYSRDGVVKILVAIFLFVLIIVGRRKGLKSVITISLTIFLIFKCLLPLMLKGYNPLLLTIGIIILVTFLTIIIVSGFHKKSFAAIIGTIFGVIIAGLISIIAAKFVNLTGLSSEEAVMLMNIPVEVDIDFRNLLFSGIILGALGAVMDVSMSIASAIQEIHLANKNLSTSELFSSGMEVGKDIMGTMSNTLILAYTGSFIPLLLLFLAYKTPLLRLINMDIVATEIVRALAGSIGLILTIPITALFMVAFVKEDNFN